MAIKTKDELVTEFDSTVVNGGEATAAEFRALNENIIDSLDNFRTPFGDSKGTFKASGNSDLSVDETGDLKLIGEDGMIRQKRYNGSIWAPVTCCIESFDITITTAQVLALNGTPITLVAAQGAGIGIELFSATASMTYNSVAYATNGRLNILCQTGVAIQGSLQGDEFLFGTVTRAVSFGKIIPSAVTDTQIIANQPLIAQVETGNPTAGNSDIRIQGTYRLIQVP